MSLMLEIGRRRDGDRVTILVTGELDLATAGRLRAELDRGMSRRGVKAVILDLRKLRFCDSAGLAVLLASDAFARTRQVDFKILRPVDPGATGVFELSGLGARLPFEPAFRAAGQCG